MRRYPLRSEELNDQIESRYGDPATFVSRLKRTLWDSGVTQAALAQETGFSAPNVNKWLNGRVTPSLKTMIILDEALERLTDDS